MKDPWKDFRIEKCIGLKQMHPMQVESLMDFIGLSLMAAAETGEDDLINQTEQKADELIRIFGGSGIRIKKVRDNRSFCLLYTSPSPRDRG